MSLTIERISTFEEFKKLEPIWNTFLEKTPADTVFLTYEFLSVWWEAFGKDKKMLVLLVKDSGKLLGIAPLMIEGGDVKFMRDVHSYYFDFIISEKNQEVLFAIFSYLEKNIEFDKLILEDVPLDSTNLGMIKSKKFKKSGFIFLKFNERVSPVIKIEEEWENYYGGIPKSRRKSIRNNLSKLSRIGNVRYCDIVNKELLPRLIKDFFLIERGSWKHTVGRSVTGDKQQMFFYKTLAERMQDKGQICLDFLFVDEKPASFVYDLVYKDKRYNLKTSFLEDYDGAGPGTYLAKEVVQNSFKKGLDCLDFLGVMDSRKKLFSNSERAAEYIYLYKSTIKNKVYVLFNQLVWKRLGRWEIIQKIKNKLLGKFPTEEKNREEFKKLQNERLNQD